MMTVKSEFCFEFTVGAPTTEPVEVQRSAIHEKVRPIFQAAAEAGVNVIGLQECWRRFFYILPVLSC